MTSEKTKYRILNALRASAPLRAGRDEVRATATGVAYYLHGNLVASKPHGKPLEPYAPTFSRAPYGFNRQAFACARF